ncbi:beta-lactamase family protein [Echinicola soli]|uniref:Beta-lactamase family protein n=1 Tax=Echinicola soli TaxID=2591634 RepID=A0A514CLM8_9BACT|nr:serine hydrolase domain-containing protein [Echinicola soli]QDH80733.1 beta-lactamase family protein [Echinicola soli]
MKHQLSLIILSFIILSQKAYSQDKSDSEVVSKAIDKHGKDFLKNKDITSVSIGVLKDGEVYTQHFGELEKGKGNIPSNESIYEVGSVTKTMTGYLVAEAVVARKIKLEDDIRLYLKGDYPNLEYNNKPVTIKHLLTHTSGLPMSLPTELNGVFESLDENVPKEYYEIEKSYDKEKFLADLKNVSLTVEPGTKYSYSNTGAELIGYVLEKVYRKSLDRLLKESFLDEYEMLSTAIELNETQTRKLVRGYWMSNTTLSPILLNQLWATAGGIKMNLTDMIRYMELQLNTEDPIVSESHKVLYDNKTLKVAYFWRAWNDKYGPSYNHHGGTTGTQNWLFIFPDHKLGISIITNQSGPKTPNLLSKTVKKILKDIIKA